MGMEALVKLVQSPKIFQALVKSSKISALRLDLHPETGALIATAALGGRVYQREVPLGVTLNQADLATLLQSPAPAAIAAAPPPDTP